MGKQNLQPSALWLAYKKGHWGERKSIFSDNSVSSSVNVAFMHAIRLHNSSIRIPASPLNTPYFQCLPEISSPQYNVKPHVGCNTSSLFTMFRPFKRCHARPPQI
ncbi:hypothetical protein CDAR_594961 [Caerostris darwini]|uniref:Uncharacterized protein n=1 Tax=Caerostris darwini TaxID=1538125 RepID=A0AAV4P9T2_9ARAC|nr:hypothetical protein CDAR_594961 [Caerostris darwini]